MTDADAQKKRVDRFAHMHPDHGSDTLMLWGGIAISLAVFFVAGTALLLSAVN